MEGLSFKDYILNRELRYLLMRMRGQIEVGGNKSKSRTESCVILLPVITSVDPLLYAQDCEGWVLIITSDLHRNCTTFGICLVSVKL